MHVQDIKLMNFFFSYNLQDQTVGKERLGWFIIWH